MAGATLMDTLSAIETLPTLPVVAQQIQKLIANPRSNMSQIAVVISRDQAISSRVIRLVNSAFYGLRTRVSSIQQAIIILGLNTVKNITLGVSVVKLFDDHAGASLFDREQFWMHSFAVALGARHMAQALRRPEPEDYFLAGLLHDLGILVLDQFVHESFVATIKKSMMDGVEYPEAEKAVLGSDHAAVGDFLMRKWQMPLFLSDVARCHHSTVACNPEDPNAGDKILIVHVADGLMRKNGLGKFMSGWKSGYDPEAASRAGVSETLVSEIFPKVEAEVKNLMREWGM